ncbi:cytochrome P450 94B3 [Cinnamomum micranthum f. kanehirae]|uniref:Cytochrome P450 94B3 n=1 Tax=Cinnamomum micranthum f. kanehirae TaxID=337451 RepID=A0A443NMT9_9MAGN|nr:cytochrome P450 94B3 [Cinnamomum micranthum f. kanehirae]
MAISIRYSLVLKEIDSLRTYPVVGTLPDFLKNRHRFLEWVTEVLIKHPANTIAVRGPGDVGGIVTANPMNVEHILKTNFENYPKGSAASPWTAYPMSRQGLPTLTWRTVISRIEESPQMIPAQRKTASFEFSKRSLRNFVMETVQQEIQNRLIPFLQTATKTNKTIDLQDIFERFTFDNVCMVAFNYDPKFLFFDDSCNLSSSPFALAFANAANITAERFRYALPFLWKLKKHFNIGSEAILKQSISTVRDFAMKIIRSRRSSTNKENTDLLSRFIISTNNSDELLRDIIISFILAGRETTSSTLAWFFWLLSTTPQVEGKIIRELESVRTQFQKGPSELFDYQELQEMQYLHAAVSEALRLYPPVAVDSRACKEDDVMPDGSIVKKGQFVAYNAYAMGRLEAIWGRDCGSFVPERWLDEKGMFRAESPYRFPAFHAGPRMCLGKEMGYIQMKSIVACVMERFEIDVLGKDQCPKHFLSLTMRIKGGLPVRVREKKMKGPYRI